MTALRKRIVGLIVDPAREWNAIAEERKEVPALYGSYIAILAAIPAVSLLIGLAIAGGRYLGRAGISSVLTAALVGYGIALAIPWGMGIVLAAAAPRFKSHGGMDEGVRLVGYALTPFWLAGLSYLFVGLSPLVTVGGLYSIYLFFLGLTPVMDTPAEQRVPFTLVAVIAELVLSVMFTWIVSRVGLPHYGL